MVKEYAMITFVCEKSGLANKKGPENRSVFHM
jgi:hypothetical protein